MRIIMVRDGDVKWLFVEEIVRETHSKNWRSRPQRNYVQPKCCTPRCIGLFQRIEKGLIFQREIHQIPGKKVPDDCGCNACQYCPTPATTVLKAGFEASKHCRCSEKTAENSRTMSRQINVQTIKK